MNKRTQQRFIILSTIFVIITAVYFGNDAVRTFFASKPTSPFPKLTASQITELTIINGNSAIKLYKRNNQWYTKKDLQEFKADKKRIENVLTSITALVKEEVVSQNTKNHKELGIEHKKITFKSGNINHSIYIGKAVGSKNFIRIDNQSDVFTARGFSDIDFSSDYRDSTINKTTDEKKE